MLNYNGLYVSGPKVHEEGCPIRLNLPAVGILAYEICKKKNH